MAFEGDISNLGLGDVLQTIAMSRQVGTFVVRGGDERRLACGPQGVALLSSSTSLGLRIGTVLVGTGKVAQSDLDLALKTQRRRRDVPLGTILVESGACSEDEMRTARRYLAGEEIFDLFLWKEGTFEFLPGEPDASGPFADLWFDVGSLAMEAARRIDELPRAIEKVPLGEVLVAVPGENREKVVKNLDLERLMELADGTRTAQDIHDTFHRGRFDTWKGLETLLEAGLLRPASKDEILDAGRDAMATRSFTRAARLFQRASLHDPEDDAIRMSISDALREAGEKRLAAEQLVQIGNARMVAGKCLPAVEAFRAAQRLDNANSEAQEGLMHALADSGQPDEAAEAARAAAGLLLSLSNYDGACRVAEAGLAQRPGDPQLLLCLANAQHGLGRSAEAVALLDDVVQTLEGTPENERKLLDVYRRILQIDPSRRDCQRRIDELQATERIKRKKLVHRVATAAGVLLLACAAVPLLQGPSASAQLAEASSLVDANRAADAKTILDGLADGALTPEEEIERAGLEARIESVLHPPASATLKRTLDAEIDARYREAFEAMKPGNERVADGLTALLAGLDLVEGVDAAKLKSLDSAGYDKIRSDSVREVHTAISTAATVSQNVASRLTAVRDRFDDTVWRREELEVLHELVEQSSQELARVDAEAWARVPALLESLVRRTRPPKDGTDKKAAADVATICEAFGEVTTNHARALSRARRKELKEGYKSAYSLGSQLEREGRLEEALEHYTKFLAQCDDLRSASPAELYGPIILELFGPDMQLDQKIKKSRDHLLGICRDMEEAQRAEASDDFVNSFLVRQRLVRDNPHIVFAKLFQMPLRIETAPPGADVVLVDGSPTGRALGRTPVATSYPIEPPVGGVKFQIRLAGYKSHDVVRRGALEDGSGVQRVELPKLASWTAKPLGTTESAPAAAHGAVIVTTRNGMVRRVDLASGTESPPFSPGLLDGFAGAAAVRGNRVFAASLDGRGFVLDAANLAPLHTFETGPVRASPLVTPRGVVVAEETGVVRLVDDSARTVWKQQFAKVKCDLALSGDDVIFVTGDSELLLVDGATGATLQRRQLSQESTWGPPSVAGTRGWIANDVGDILCFDAASLRDTWTQRLDGPVRGHISANAKRVVACTANGSVVVFDAETSGVLAKCNVGAKVDDGPADLPDGGFVVVTRSGNATRFDVNGQLVWRFDAGEEVSAPPRLLEAMLILVTRKGTVIALTP